MTILKPLTVWIITNCEKLLKRWEYHTILSAPWEACMQDKKQKLEPDMEQWTGSKLGKVKVKSLSCVWFFAIPWTVAYQAPPSMGFSKQECWSGLPFPSPGDLPNPGIEPRSPELQADALPSEPPGKPQIGKGVRQGCILSPCIFNLYAEYIMWNARLDES